MILRAHHLICILGFRGLGYSPDYVANMSRIVAQLRSSPQSLIEVVTKPDDICVPCPFLTEGGCRVQGPESEGIVRDRDLVVMARLGLVAGDKVTWPDAVARIRSSICPADLDEICGDCQWLPLGYCQEGLERV